MNAYTADSKISYQLPSLSYVDAKWEEPNLRTPATTPDVPRRGGLAAWLSRRFAAFVAWRSNRQAADELYAMSDRELLDIGLSRSDVGRAFTPAFNRDLQERGRVA